MKNYAASISVLAALIAMAIAICTTKSVAASDNLLDNPGPASGEKTTSVAAGNVQAVIKPSLDHGAAGQEIGVVADFNIAPGWHIYGKPLPHGYTSTAVAFDNDLVAKQTFDFPKPQMVSFAALGETLPVYQGNLRAKGKILIRAGLQPGAYKLSGKVDFQECSDQICKMPQSIAFQMPFKVDAAK